jgi:hypothetical protein
MNKLIFAIVTTALLIAGCGGDPNAGSCERIVEACHDKDTGSGEPHDCHVAAEATSTTDAACAEMEEACLAACQ